MGQKESNEVRIIGVLPSQGADPIPVGKIPDDATQIAKSNHATNETSIVRTVGAGKTLYLSTVSFQINNSAGAPRTLTFGVRNASDVEQYLFAYNYLGADGRYSDSLSFLPPVEIPTGYDVFVYSDGADAFIQGFVHGYEV